MHVDILIKNGHVYDPGTKTDYMGDLTISNKKIVSFNPTDQIEPARIINADGCLVIPGLIDSHTHINRHGTFIGMNPDIAGIPMGVTAMVDGGSTGVSNYRSFLHQLDAYETKTKIALNVCAGGQIMSTQYTENVDPSVWDISLFERAFDDFPNRILGLKIRTSRNIVKELGMTPLKKTVELAQHLGTRVFVHSTNPPCTMAELTEYLRPGDVICHMYHGNGNTVIENGKVSIGVRKAQERGIIFDISQGQGNFAIPVAQQAINEGFYPDTVSTDLNIDSWNNPLAYSLLMTMTKLMAMGLPFDKLIIGATKAPAEIMGLQDELGTLSVGTCADVTIVKLADRSVQFKDIYGNTLISEKMLLPMATIIDGQIQYRSPETL